MIRKIRTRGQTRVRNVFKWVFYSRAHLRAAVATAAVGLLVVSIGSSVAGNLLAGPPKPPTPTILEQRDQQLPPQAQTWLYPPTTAAPTPEDPTGAVEDRARRFTRAWLNTSPGWKKRIEGQVIPTLFLTMQTTNLDAIPARGAVGPVDVVAATDYDAVAEVPVTPRLTLRITLLRSNGEWMVADLAEAA